MSECTRCSEARSRFPKTSIGPWEGLSDYKRKNTMQKPDHHIFVCASFRGTEAKGKCIKKDSLQLIPYLEEQVLDRGLNAMVSSTGCLKLCEEGPVVIVYPQGYWYRGITSEEAVDEILDALENGGPAEKYLLT
jgi:(2Fe-2S) ferredoxin